MDPLANLEERLGLFLGQLGLEGAHDADGITAVRAGDSLVLLSTLRAAGATWLRLTAVVQRDVSPSVSLLHHILALNRDLVAGAFQLFDDRTITFGLSLPGETLDADTFERALRLVAASAEDAGPDIEALAGGTTWRGTARETSGC